MDLDQQVRQLKQDIEQLQKSKARAEMEQDSARATLASLKKSLSEEFGVTDSDSAREVLKSLEDDLQNQLTTTLDLVRKAQNG